MNMNDFIEVLKIKYVMYYVDGDKIFVNGNLDLSDMSITSLPDNLSIIGYLDLSHTKITTLPDNLSVGGLNLSNTGITCLPDNLSVGDYLCLQPENIANVVYSEYFGGTNRTIFAAWVNGGIHIADNFYLKTPAEFEKALDLKHSSNDAEDYKQAARECVAELEQRRKAGGAA